MSEASDGFAPGFTPGFVARHTAAAELLHQAFAPSPRGFAPVAVGTAPRPRHFSPADPGRDPTAGWNPFDPADPPRDPVGAAHAAGFAEGEAAALAAGAERQAADRLLLADLAAALAASGRVDREAVARRIRQTVLQLVTQLVGEAGISAELLTRRIAAATELLADASESALLRLNPADVPLVEGRLPATVFAAGDASLPRGSFALESASTVVEDGPDLWLDQLTDAIDRAAVPCTASC